MRFKRPKHHTDGLVTLLLFGVFAACVLSVLLTGAKVYRTITAGNQREYSRRTCAQYLSTKVRQARSAACVQVSEDSLDLRETIDGDDYVTSIYCYDGWLWEIFTFDGWDFDPEDGERILKAQDMELSLEDGLLTVDITDEAGENTHLVLSLRGEAAA